MLSNTIANAFVQVAQELAKALLAISHALNERNRQAHLANQIEYLKMRQHKGNGGWPNSVGDLLVQVGTKVSTGTREQRR
ncbi:hypothetical protein GS534_24390 [Rhodococcus hoagii]|nr:hypothetical protein [Prescottella equi]MBM4617931.1 hypothetical protein [Prescottella equi]NKS33170.1 hypothetical protein [Prescottella equi]